MTVAPFQSLTTDSALKVKNIFVAVYGGRNKLRQEILIQHRISFERIVLFEENINLLHPTSSFVCPFFQAGFFLPAVIAKS